MDGLPKVFFECGHVCVDSLSRSEDDLCYSSLTETKRSVEEKISKCKSPSQLIRTAVEARIIPSGFFRQFLPFEYFLTAPK